VLFYRESPTELFLAILSAVNQSGDYRVISAYESEGLVRAASITKKPVDNLVEFRVSYSDSGSMLNISILDASPQAYMKCDLLISMFEMYGPTYRPPMYITWGRFQHLTSLHLAAMISE
jgi:hypothetical protein